MSLRARLGLRLPLVLAPMAGVSTPALVAAVSEAGGLGSLGAAYLSPADLRAAGEAVQAQTGYAWAVNLFVPGPTPVPSAEAQAAAEAELAPFHAALGLEPPRCPAPAPDPFEAQWREVLALRPAAFSFTFGVLPPEFLTPLRDLGTVLIGTATSVEEVRALAAAGVDAVTVQGREAGGHRGGWAHDALSDTLALTRAAAGVTDLPLMAAGGIMDRDAVAAALGAGAELAQCGTAFLLTEEAGTSAPYRAALQAATEDTETVLTRAFSGRLARGLSNAVTRAVHSPLPYPLQNALTRPMRTAAAAAGEPEYLSLWAGTGVAAARPGRAADRARELTQGLAAPQ